MLEGGSWEDGSAAMLIVVPDAGKERMDGNKSTRNSVLLTVIFLWSFIETSSTEYRVASTGSL